MGFEALLAVLTAAQDQAALASDPAGKLAAPAVVVPVVKDGKLAAKDLTDKDASKTEAAAKAGADGGAIAIDVVIGAQDASATVPVTLSTLAVQTAPVAAAPAKAAPAAETTTTETVLASGIKAAPVAPRAATALPADASADGQPEAPAQPAVQTAVQAATQTAPDAEPMASGPAKLDPGPAIAPAAPSARRIDRAEAKPSASPAPAAPVNAAPAAAPALAQVQAQVQAPVQAQAPAQPPTQAQAQAAPAPAATHETVTPTPAAAAPALAEAAAPAQVVESAQVAAPTAPSDGPKDPKGPSRYARNEVERSRVAQATTAGAPAIGSAISAKMADVAQSANNPQAEAFALAPASGEDATDVAPAVLAAASDAQEPAAPSADLNTATSNTTAPATVTHAAALVVRGEPQTVANLAAQILKKLDGRSTRFDVALDPIGMGHVDVRVEIGAHGRMTAAMAFDTPQAAAELRARAGELKSALEQAGFDISGGLSFDVAGDSGQSRGSAGQDDQQAPAFRGRAFQTALDTSADPAPGRAFQYRRSSASGVDIRI